MPNRLSTHTFPIPAVSQKKKELWDALEKFDELYSDPKIIKLTEADPFDPSNFTQQTITRGTTQYIFVENKNWVPPADDPQLTHDPLGSLEEEDEKCSDNEEEKIMDAD